MRESLPFSFQRVQIDNTQRGDVWKTGDGIIQSVNVTEGTNERSSSCEVTLNDVDNSIAAKYIEISFKEGGIVGLPPEPTATPTTPGSTAGISTATGNNVANEIIAECLRQGITAPHKIAFILAIAEGESSLNHNAYNDEDGAFGQYGGRGLGQITHDYNYSKWSKRLGVDLVKNPALAHRPDISTTILVGGIKEGWTGAGGIDRHLSNPTSDTRAAYQNIQGGVWRPAYQNFYAKWLQRVPSTLATTPPNPNTATKLPDTVPVTNKGRVIKVSLGFESNRLIYNSEFIHTGTVTDYKGITVLRGQSVRSALMNKVKRNAAFKEISLFELATKVATAYKLTPRIDNAAKSIKLDYVDQSGITDYQLLRRECEFHGFTLRDDKEKFIVERPTAKNSGYVINFIGGDWDTWELEDKAASTYEEIKTAASVKSEAKTTVDANTGAMVSLQAESQRTLNPLPGSTGASLPAPVAEPTQSLGERWVQKRVKGLPLRVTSPTTPALLRLKPNDAVFTAGHPRTTFNRAWTIDTLNHTCDLGKMFTTLTLYTPMDVKVIEQPQQSATVSATTPTDIPTDTEWQHPVSGASSCGARCEYGYARGRLHAGLDYGGYGNDTVVAVRNGVVVDVKNDTSGGYGRLIDVRHDNGYKSRYAHLASISVRVGEPVRRGQPIGVRGGSGYGSNDGYAIHLHFELHRPDGTTVNPRDVLPKQGSPIIVG